MTTLAPARRELPEQSVNAPARRATLAALAMLGVAAAVRLPSLDQPLVEAYGFRLTFTAWPARIFHEEGVSLLHPQVPALGTPWQIPMEFPLFQAMAALLMDAGMPEVVALRGLSLVFFSLTGWLLFRLVVRCADEASALAALLVFLFSPLAFLWSRAALMEFLVTAATLAWALTAWNASARSGAGCAGWTAAALTSGTVAMLVKPTTAAWWVVPVLVGMGLTLARARETWERRRWAAYRPWVLGVAVVLVPLAAAAAWTRHADAVKAASPGTEFLTSRGAAAWNFGTLAQRWDPQAWSEALGHLVPPVTGAAGVAAAVLLVVHRRWVGPTLWAVVATVPLTVLTFWNLYVVHGYYWSAVAPAVAAAIGVGAVLGIRRLPQQWRSMTAVAAAAGWLLTTLLAAWTYVALPYSQFPEDYEAMGVGARLASFSEPDDQVYVTGLGWDPSILYFADRRGLMVHDDLPRSLVAGQPDRDSYRFAVVLKPGSQWLGSTLVRGWAAPRDPAIYQLASSQEELDGSAVQFSARGLGTTSAGVASPVGCEDVAQALAGATDPIRLAVRGDDSARLWVSDSLAPVPGSARTVVIDPSALPADWRIRCSGRMSIEWIGASS